MIPELLRPLTESAAATVTDPATAVDALVPTTNPAHGDYQWNFAFRSAKALRTAPRALAERLRPLLANHPGVREVEVAGPGFLNIRLHDSFVVEAARRAAGSLPQIGAGQTVVIDYSSPNVAKRMHIGHMRSTHLGHALDGLHRATGHRVIADNHIGDWGTQFGKLIVAWHRWLDPEHYAEDPIGELERLYVHFGNQVAENPALADEARAGTVKLQQGDEASRRLWREFMEVSLREFNAVYERLGVRFDETLGESAYAEALPDVVKQLVDRGVARSSEGAVVVSFDEPALKDHVLMIQKRDGGFNYATTDIATVQYRVARWNPQRIIYVTDTRQQLHFKQFFSVARTLGVQTELVHAWFGMLTLPEGAMSTRKGNTIRLVELLDEATRRARVVVDQKSPELPEEQRDAIASAVGINAVRYADISQNPQTDIVFTWDKMLALDGNTAPFLMYSHARCCSLLHRAGQAPEIDRISVSAPAERELLLSLARYPEAAVDALRTLRPNVLAEHLYEICGRINRFWHDVPVLFDTTPEERASRLGMIELARRVLRSGLEVLGLRVLDRM